MRISFLTLLIIFSCFNVLISQSQSSALSVKGVTTTDTLKVDKVLSLNASKQILVIDTLLLKALGNAKLTDSFVTVDAITGQLRRRNGVTTRTNIYNGDGTLSANRTVTMAGKNLNFMGGYIGINNATPNAPLQFENVFANRKIVLYEQANNDNQFNGFGVNNNIVKYQIASSTTAHVFYSGMDANSSKELMRIQGNGNIGIGTSTPNASLQFENVFGNRKIVFWEQANNDHQFNGFGINNNVTRYQVANSANAHVFYSGIDANSSKELMRIQGNGNVGIGNATPNAALQFGNIFESRKIVLWEQTNNDNQFNGFGVNNGSMRYQITNSANAHIFYSGIDANNSQELMRIQGNGNIGINNATPNAPLQFGNIFENRKIVLYEQANNDHQFNGFGTNNNVLRYQITNSANAHIFYSGIDANSSKELMRIQGNGNVGIGISTPNAPLQFANNIANRKIVLWEQANNDNQFYGLGINNNIMRYQVAYNTNAHIFYSGIDATSSKELMRITGNGNVGIGNTTPNAPLQFENVFATRKIVLGEFANNDNQFNGFGLDDNVLRYQVATIYDAHIFYAGMGANNSQALMYVLGNGNVGIGTAVPNAPLQFANNAANRKIVLYEQANNDNQFNGFGIGAGTLRYQVLGNTNAHVFYSGIDANSSKELMRIQGNGNVGIGTLTPNAPLQFDNIFANRKIVLWEQADNDNQFNGFGVNSGSMRYQISTSTSNHIFYAGSSELMRIQGNGFIGIGTSSPRAPLDVRNSGDFSMSSGAYFRYTGSFSTGAIGSGGVGGKLGILAEYNILSQASIISTQTLQTSDRRIKKDITLSDNKADLNILNKIRVTNYRYKDIVKQGNDIQKKVIAQELEEVFPQAVMKSKNYIPNVYQVSKTITYLSDTTALLTFENALDSECIVGRPIRINTEEGQEIYGSIKEVKEKGLVITKVPKNQKKIFIYGVEVNDFRNVDYDALTMLNVSSTQEMYKTIQELKNIVQQQDKQLEEIFKLLNK